VAGTLIQTRDGEKAIQDIQIGDWVLSDDPSTPGDIEYKQVLQTFNHETNYLVDVYIGGEKITTTENHPFWVKDVGWVAARDLGAGAQLETKGESWLGVERVDRHTSVATVYNFEVQGFHTYFVSDLGLLVHNACEEIVPKNSFEQARNYAIDKIGEINPATRKPVIGKFGGQEGNVVGFETRVNGEYKRFRVDFDPNKGPHINVEIGKGADRIKEAVTFPGNEQDVLKIIGSMYH
jgi:Pretoxin HINT domain